MEKYHHIEKIFDEMIDDVKYIKMATMFSSKEG
jgi:hypothetical protein